MRRKSMPGKLVYCGIMIVVFGCIMILSELLYYLKLTPVSQLQIMAQDSIPKCSNHIDATRCKSSMEIQKTAQIDNVFTRWSDILYCIINANSNCISDDQLLTLLQQTLVLLTDLAINSTDLNDNPILSSSTTNKYQYSFHDFIKLRRQIMIVNHVNTTKDLFISSNKMQYQNKYNQILNIFAKSFGTHKLNRNQYPWFHFHVSKSAGSTIKSTFMYPFKQKSKNNNYWVKDDHTCSRQYESANIIQKVYFHREIPLFTYNDYLNQSYHGPSLCNKMIYIMGFREPLQRICSQASQMNKKPLFNLQNLFRTYESYIKVPGNNNRSDPLNHIDQCYQQNITINGVDYRLVLKGRDYHGFFTELLSSEHDELYSKLPEIHTAKDIKNRIKMTSIPSNKVVLNISNYDCIKHKPDYTKIKDRWMSIKYQQGNKLDKDHVSEFVLYSHKDMVDISYHRCKSGSNVYTSWLGYNYSRDDVDDFPLINSYIPRYKINDSHLLNAMDLLLKIDYVLPLNNPKIWDITLDHIYDYFMIPGQFKEIPNVNRSKIKWVKSNQSGNNHNRISSKDIYDNLSKKDKELLLKYNKYDYILYDLAKLIGTVDLIFYDQIST